MSETSRRIANVLANTRIMKMSSAISSSSDEEGESSLHRSHDQSISSLDTDADESEHENSYNNNNNNGKPTTKSRRLLKTRKTSFSSLNNNYTPPISRIYMRKDDSQPQSSSNDDEQKEITIIHDEPTSNNNNNNNTNSRRLKTFPSKKRDQMLTAATTTTTDDDTTKYHHHRYHPLDSFHSNHRHAQTESARSASIPTISTTNPFSLNRKSNRFQIKSIRKSQQQHVLVANATAAKSSNDDDCSQPVPRPKFALRHPLAARKHTNTPTTDGETSTTNTDSIVNGAVSALKTAENGYPRVRFHVPQSKKTESAAEEEKSVTTTSSLPTPAPPSSTASAQGEVSKQTDFINQK